VELSDGVSEKELREMDTVIASACSDAMAYLKHVVANRYLAKGRRMMFTAKEFARDARRFYDEYPVAISTTFSSRRCLPYFSREFLFDYVIMDEASQVDVATGALALSCARNAVIVGDKMQLPNVVTTADKERAREMLERCNINEAYDYSRHSFLSSVEALIPDVPQTLLREHYRCHPKIIEFCNRKFYDNQLLVMTKDLHEQDVINVYRTNEGNHCRGHVNRRQIDVIIREILPGINGLRVEEVGIITPYRDQAAEIRAVVPEIPAATVHKFQGREKDVIIISTVDDRITPFADDANLLNVAISRARSKLFLVMSGNEQPRNTNLGDLIDYINYNNFTVAESRVNSVFDYLYSQYAERRRAYVRDVMRVSRYDSENLMYGLINDVLKETGHQHYGVVFEQPLKELLNAKQIGCLSEEERWYALIDWTHVDFLVYNRVSKQPVLAIEVDGYSFHKRGTRQAERDKLKDSVFEKCGIRLLRFSTTGSQERERLLSALGQDRTCAQC
jgi:very-short-patch-repair endonuclease